VTDVPSPDIKECEACGERFFFARTLGGAVMPVNVKPDRTGNLAVHQDVAGTWHARVMRKGEEPRRHEKPHLPHFATCTRPADFRRRLAQARAERNKTTRNNRSHRRAAAAAAIEQPGLFRIESGR